MRYFGIIWAAKSKPIWPWSKLEKFFDTFLFNFASILIFENFAVEWAYTDTVFCCEISTTKIYVHFGPIRWVLCRFSIFWFYVFEIAISWAFLVMYEYFSMHWLSQRVTFLSLAEPTPKRFHRWLSQCRTNFLLLFSQRSILSQRENGLFSIHNKERLGFDQKVIFGGGLKNWKRWRQEKFIFYTLRLLRKTRKSKSS